MDLPPSSQATGSRSVDDILLALKDAIWKRRPILGDIMQKHGDKSLFDYAKDFMDVNPLPIVDTRKHELISVVQKLATDIFGKSTADAIAAQLTSLPLVSTTDHHGPVTHPFFVNSNIITALPMLQSANELLKYIIVFSFAGVSNNNSAFPRGVLFHGGQQTDESNANEVVRLPLLPDKLKMSVVHATRPMTRQDVEHGIHVLQGKIGKGVTQQKFEEIEKILREYFLDPEVLALPDYSSQISRINFTLWSRYFHGAASSTPTPVPRLVYIDIEKLVADTVLQFHIDNDTLINRALFNPVYIDLIRRHFDGIPGAFSTTKNWGTHFFWGLDAKQHRVRLFYADGSIQSLDASIRVELKPEAIRTALVDKKIFPSMALCYLVVSLYYGMKCLGGFCQVHDLTMLKSAWQQILREAGEGKEAQAIEDLQTKELGGDGMVLSYLRNAKGELMPATGLDMIIEDQDTRLEHFQEPSKDITLSEAMLPLLPEIYTVLYTIEERDPSLLITPAAILKDSNLAKKIDASFKR